MNAYDRIAALEQRVTDLEAARGTLTAPVRIVTSDGRPVLSVTAEKEPEGDGERLELVFHHPDGTAGLRLYQGTGEGRLDAGIAFGDTVLREGELLLSRPAPEEPGAPQPTIRLQAGGQGYPSLVALLDQPGDPDSFARVVLCAGPEGSQHIHVAEAVRGEAEGWARGTGGIFIGSQPDGTDQESAIRIYNPDWQEELRLTGNGLERPQVERPRPTTTPSGNPLN